MPYIQSPSSQTPQDDAIIFTVSQLNREVKLLLEQQFGFIWIEGEISNFSQPASGHWYFSLKDGSAQIRCAMFKGRNQRLGFKPKNGEQVLVRGSLGLYEARGDFQLIAQSMQPIGDGLLQQRFEQTKQKLHEMGLFDENRKKPIPTYPQCIGIITSATGAALQDVLQVLSRRYPAANIIIYPTMVQGTQAAPQIAMALSKADRRKECDVLLLVRGGGSLEDLWSFNEEIVAFAIAKLSIAIISGVGHEVDFTIADWVADLRAPTPSAAAELATPDIREQRARIQGLHGSLNDNMQQKLNAYAQGTDQLERRLINQHPQQQLQRQLDRVSELKARLTLQTQQSFKTQQNKLLFLSSRLKNQSPEKNIQRLQEKIKSLTSNITQQQQQHLQQQNTSLKSLMRALDGVSPLATLNRGYSVLKTTTNKPITSIKNIKQNELLVATLADGNLFCRVEKISK